MLPSDLVEPIVVVNGSTDNTAAVAERFGARVIDFEEPGKLPAIQGALRKLGNKALNPTLILDADNRPIFPRSWATGMAKTMQRANPEQSVFVGGPVWFREGGLVNDGLRSMRRLRLAYRSQDWDGTKKHGQLAPNMALHIKEVDLLEEVLSLPHYWPGEDLAVLDTLVKYNGAFYQPLSPALMTWNPSSDSYLPLLERVKRGREESTKRIVAHYINRGAKGSTPYPPELLDQVSDYLEPEASNSDSCSVVSM